MTTHPKSEQTNPYSEVTVLKSTLPIPDSHHLQLLWVSFSTTLGLSSIPYRQERVKQITLSKSIQAQKALSQCYYFLH